MKLFKRVLICIAAIVLLTGAAAGCSTDTGGPSATPAPDGSPSQSADASATPDQAAGIFNAGEEYRYFTWAVTEEDPFPNNTELFKRQKAEMKEKLENTYGITIKYIGPESESTWTTEVGASAYAGKPMTDILDFGASWTQVGIFNYQRSAGSLLVPIGLYENTSDFTDEQYWDQISQQSCTYNGQLYFAVPYNSSVGNYQVTFFNRQVLADAGYDDETLYKLQADGEWTWDKFREIAAAATDMDKGIYGTAFGQTIENFVYSNDAAFFEKTDYNGTIIEQFAGNKPNAVAAWQFLLDMAAEGTVNTELYQGDNYLSAAFFRGELAMMCTWAARAADQDTMGLDYGILYIPKGPQADDYTSAVIEYNPFGVYKGHANPEGCVKLLNEFVRPYYAKDSDEIKAEIDVEISEIALDQGSADTLRNVAQYAVPANYRLYQRVPVGDDGQSNCATVIWYAGRREFFDGGKSPQQYFDSIAEMVNQALLEHVYSMR